MDRTTRRPTAVLIAPVASVALAASGGSGASGAATASGSRSRGYPPQTLQPAYGVSPLLRQGIDGRGETVALPEATVPGLFDMR